MNTDTTIAKNIRVSDEKASYDAACKRLLSEKIILAWIMKNCVEEYRDCDVNEIAEQYIEGQPQVGETAVAPDETNRVTRIHGIGVEDATLSEGTITYDIRFLAAAPASGELIRLIINIEAQNDFYPGYPLIKRGIYYCSRMISAQYGTEFTEGRYGNIILKTDILAKDIIPMPDDFDIENYTKEVFFMFSGEKVLVDLRCDNSLMKTMVDRFGEEVTTLAYDMTSFRVQTEVSASPTFFGWVFGFNGKVQILAPESVKEQYRQMIAKADEDMQESK